MIKNPQLTKVQKFTCIKFAWAHLEETQVAEGVDWLTQGNRFDSHRWTQNLTRQTFTKWTLGKHDQPNAIKTDKIVTVTSWILAGVITSYQRVLLTLTCRMIEWVQMFEFWLFFMLVLLVAPLNNAWSMLTKS